MKTVALLAGLSTLFSLVSAGYVESAASYDTHIARLRHRRAYAGRRHRRRDGEASSTPIQTRMVADTEYTSELAQVLLCQLNSHALHSLPDRSCREASSDLCHLSRRRRLGGACLPVRSRRDQSRKLRIQRGWTVGWVLRLWRLCLVRAPSFRLFECCRLRLVRSEPRSFARTGNPSCYTACATTGLSGYELDLTRGNSFVQNEDSNVYGEHTYTYCSYIASGATNPSAFCAYSAATCVFLARRGAPF